RIHELLEYMNLMHKKDALIQTLSGGMKRRLVFVRALLGRPELLILDEPTTGLDPAVRHLLWGKVRELHQQGTTIVLTTHYMHEAEMLCDRLVIMNQGHVVAEGSPQKMIEAQAPGYVGIFHLEAEAEIRRRLQDHANFDLYKDTSGFYLRTSSLDALMAFHNVQGIRPLQIRPSNLEDVFLKLTGKELSSDA
ncbi:MAG: ABC transporter ATP-binding protein, partial [Bdellovibrio sp.]